MAERIPQHPVTVTPELVLARLDHGGAVGVLDLPSLNSEKSSLRNTVGPLIAMRACVTRHISGGPGQRGAVSAGTMISSSDPDRYRAYSAVRWYFPE